MARMFTNAFPGYEYIYDDKDKQFHNMYRGVDVGKGGYVYANPGIYGNVALLDVASLHPNSIRAMNCFGEYTKNFTDILDARIAIKHGDYETASKMLDGKLAPYLKDKTQAKALSQALKIAINSVYGLTAAGFENPFKDSRNKNNIVALRGALFMKTLQDEVEKRGFTVVHIKTDSIKVADATPEIIEFINEFGKDYGYTFEHEATYEKICLVNNAVYIAKYATVDQCIRLYGEEYVYKDNDTLKGNKEEGGQWTATGTQFQVPYVFKTLFSKEPIEFSDLCETKEVKAALYLDMNERLPDVTMYEKELEKLQKNVRDPKSKLNNMTVGFEAELHKTLARIEELKELIKTGHDYHFVGKVGSFCPIKPGCGGAELVRGSKTSDGTEKYDSAAGAKDYRWLEAEMVKTLNKEKDIDHSYYVKLVDEAIESISQYGDFEMFASDDPYIPQAPHFAADGPVNPDEIPFDLN